jgi:hypothetical protein
MLLRLKFIDDASSNNVILIKLLYEKWSCTIAFYNLLYV